MTEPSLREKLLGVLHDNWCKPYSWLGKYRQEKTINEILSTFEAELPEEKPMSRVIPIDGGRVTYAYTEKSEGWNAALTEIKAKLNGGK